MKFLVSVPALVLVVSLLSACATTGGEQIYIEAGNDPAAAFAPDELELVLSDHGFHWVPLVDPDTDQPAKALSDEGALKMRFQHSEQRRLFVDLNFQDRRGLLSLHFFNTESSELSQGAMDIVRKLRQRLVLEFGPENVSD